jgi:fatty acid desaturase
VFRCQAYLFFPLLALEGVNLHVASIQALTRRSSRRRFRERALITVHVAGYLAVVFLVLSPVRAVVFMIVQQGLLGLYLGCSFAPNHKDMPTVDAADHCDFPRRQALTSRNVHGGWLTDFALGGLNYQIEHHLFPSMPQPPAARRAVLPEQPGGLLRAGAASPRCRWQASPPGRGDLSGGPGSQPHAPPAAGGDCLAESTGAGGVPRPRR